MLSWGPLTAVTRPQHRQLGQPGAPKGVFCVRTGVGKGGRQAVGAPLFTVACRRQGVPLLAGAPDCWLGVVVTAETRADCAIWPTRAKECRSLAERI
jgi:hypothetical protein